MKLFTKEIKKKMPKMRAQSEVGLENLTFYMKLFAPWGNWTWYVAEADFETGEAFGLVCGFEKEVGYFDLNELSEIKGPFGLKIERELVFSPITYVEAMKRERA